MPELRSVREVWLSAVMLLSSASGFAAHDTPPPPTGVVAVGLLKPDFLWRDISTRVLVDVTKTKRVPLSDFDMASALSAACAQELNRNSARPWRVASVAEMPAMEPYFAGKSSILPASSGADRVFAIYVVEYGALKVFVESNRKFFLNATTLLFDPRTGKEIWRRGYIEKIAVEGRFEDLVANEEAGLKLATGRLIAQFCAEVRKKVESTP